MITREDFKGVTMQLSFRGRTSTGSIVVSSCARFPSLGIIDTYDRRTRTATRHYVVGDVPCSDLDAVIAALNAEAELIAQAAAETKESGS